MVVAAAVLASAATLANDFVYDDIPLIRDNDRLHDITRWSEIAGKAYWPPPFVEQLYRPLAVLSLAIQYILGRGNPLIFRIVSCALYVACVLLFWRLASRFVRPQVATGLAILFAVHPLHVEAVAQAVNQGELLVAIIACMIVLRYVDSRRANVLSIPDWALFAVLYAAATLIKESGFVLPGLLLLAEAFAIQTDTLRQRARKLWIGYTALAAVGVCMVLWRSQVLGLAFSSRPDDAIAGLDLGGRLIAMLQMIPTVARLFLWPAHLQVDYALPPRAALSIILGILIVGGAVVAFVVSRKRAPALAFGLAWCVITLLPVSNIVPTGVLLAERTLFLPSIGFMLAVAAVADPVFHQATPTTKRSLVAIVMVLAALGIVRSTSRHLVWNPEHLRVVRPQVR